MPLGVNDTLSFIVSTIESHSSSPLPAVAKQTDKQSLLYETSAYIASPYNTASQRTKIKSPTADIHSYSNPSSLSRFTSNAPVTKSGASITYGPYHDMPPSDGKHFAESIQETVKIHYQYDNPVLTIAQLRRAAEISHWGANLNIQDDIHLRNDGSKCAILSFDM
jgi:oligosaccharyltransferase complex subunit alpha (ribophorin I)